MAELLGLNSNNCSRYDIAFSSSNVPDLRSMGWSASKTGNRTSAPLDGCHGDQTTTGLDSGVYLEYHIQCYNLISVLYITIFIVIAHLITPKKYEWTKNTISELAAQGYDRKWIMQLGFVGFGLILGIGSLVRLLQFEEHWYTKILYWCTQHLYLLLEYSAQNLLLEERNIQKGNLDCIRSLHN